MQSLLKRGLLLGSTLLLSSPVAMAAWTFNNGDLILGFQATGGQGSGTNVFFNLGSGTSHRDNGTQGVLGNIDFDLTQAYGEDWNTRTDLYFGVIGNLNANPNTGPGSAAAVNGDPSRTFYVSQATVNPGEAVIWTGFTGTALGTAGTSLTGMESMVTGLNTTASGAAVLDQATQSVEWNNGWSSKNPTPGAAFTVFTGGIQNSFVAEGGTRYVDVQRIISTTTGANPTGPIGTGTYETTISIGSDGTISAIPEPSTTLLIGLAGVASAFRRRRNA